MGELIIPVKITSEKLTQEQELVKKWDEIVDIAKEYNDTLNILDNIYREHYESLLGIMKEPDDDILHALTVAKECVEKQKHKTLAILLSGTRGLISEVKKV